ncbi:MAG TPA: heparinase II/III family protein, partial [Myxococcota bacterium]|nr:heparinase II/III family protein [Myxococcota bacterium]
MRLATLYRTLRHVRPVQWVGRVRHRLHGVRPVAFAGPTPPLAPGPPLAAFLPAPPASEADGVRRFRLLDREVVFDDGIDWRFEGEGPLWTFQLHQFHWARDPGIAPETRAAAILDWIERYPEGYGWWSDPTSFRILNWTKLLLVPGALPDDPDTRDRIARSIASQCETLARHLETHLLANHYFTNLAALVFAGLAFQGPDADRWLALGAAFRGQLAEQIGRDGAHYERAPMYHAALLEQVLDVLHGAKRSGRASDVLRDALGDVAARMLGALDVVTHPDGEIALFADSAFGYAHPPAALRAYGAALGVAPRAPDPPGLLADAGYVRLEAGPFVLVASVAGPAPAPP